MKGLRIVFLTTGLACSIAAVEVARAPIHAAQQPTPGAEPPAVPAHGSLDPGAASYAKRCAVCHGVNRDGNLPGFPALAGINHRLTQPQIADLIHNGKGRMPAFPTLQGAELNDLLHFLDTPPPVATSNDSAPQRSPEVTSGEALFHQNCAFCHGRDAMGGETGPDLTQSKLVLGDKTGEAIATVVHEGRPEKKMPSFSFSSQEVTSLVAFIRYRVQEAAAHPGGRRGVAIEDLQTGNADAGKAYFNGAGGCSKCHSPTGDLAGIARRYQGLQLEMQMLYPEHARGKLTVTLPSGEKITGVLAYKDEFTVGLRDENGAYRSWSTTRVKYTIDDPAEAHAEQFPKYTDDDIHNLMAYLQTLR